MHIYPINTSINNQASFKAFLLKDNVELTDSVNGEPINAAIVELETEPRELIADARYRARQKMSNEEFDKILTDKLLKFEDKYSALDEIANYEKNIYLGDYKFMNDLAEKGTLPYIREINKRIQSTNLFNREFDDNNAISIGKYWHDYTNGKMDIVPSKNYGLSDKKLDGYIKTGYPWNLSPIDSFIPLYFDSQPKRQRILLAVNSQNDGNYRDLKPDTKVYGLAEIYTERAMDAIEGYCTGREKQFAEIRNDEKELDNFIKKWADTADRKYIELFDKLLYRILHKNGISENEFLQSTYIKSPKQLGEEAINDLYLKDSKIEPVHISSIGILSHIKGTGKALLKTICEKGKYCGVEVNTSDLMTEGFFAKYGFKNIPGLKENKLFKPGIFKMFH